MREREPESEPTGMVESATQYPGTHRAWIAVLGLLLVVSVVVVGSPLLDAPWIQGDEHIFIARNPDVTGSVTSEPTGWRAIDIFLHAHEDLYQPFTILTYAFEWSVWGDRRVMHIRLTDILIHALNGLLLWAALRALLRRLFPESAGAAVFVGWALAFVWALHPMLVGAFAADMGRTHLLAATFVFLSLLLHLRSLQPGGWPWFIAAFCALLLAMLNKPMVGWVIVAFALEWVVLGLRRTLTSPRIYLIGTVCAGFALLTLWTTKETMLVEDSPLPLFGDPIARAALGLWIYLRNVFVPADWLSFWYPPDIRTGWAQPLVWLGTFATVLAAIAAVITARSPRTRGITLGLVWCWAMWLPVSGLVGARVLAAQDRYMYQPMVGLLLAVGVGLTHWIRRARDAARRRALIIAGVALLIGVAAIPRDAKLCRLARSTLERAERAADLNPDDPRVQEFLAAAYEFCVDHDTPEARSGSAPDFFAGMAETLNRAAELAEKNPRYFGDDYARAGFHRRLSYRFWNMGRFAAALQQAERARAFEPESPGTWLRLAHAYRSLERWDDALAAYEKLEEIMPADAEDRHLRMLEHADLLFRRFDDPSRALLKYRDVITLEHFNEFPSEVQQLAILGAARCEVLAGKGSDGFQLAVTILRAEPNNLEAARIVALYHLRSHHWDEADRVYRQILRVFPTDYECLSRFQNVCRIKGNWRDAAYAWEDARELEPDNLLLRSYWVWSAASAGESAAEKWADELLEVSPDNRFACLARMLLAIRAGQFEQALDWIRRARRGPKLPLAAEFSRAEATLKTMLERQELAAEAVMMQAALCGETGEPDRGRQLLQGYLESKPEGPARQLAERILTQDLPPETAP